MHAYCYIHQTAADLSLTSGSPPLHTTSTLRPCCRWRETKARAVGNFDCRPCLSCFASLMGMRINCLSMSSCLDPDLLLPSSRGLQRQQEHDDTVKGHPERKVHMIAGMYPDSIARPSEMVSGPDSGSKGAVQQSLNILPHRTCLAISWRP